MLSLYRKIADKINPIIIPISIPNWVTGLAWITPSTIQGSGAKLSIFCYKFFILLNFVREVGFKPLFCTSSCMYNTLQVMLTSSRNIGRRSVGRNSISSFFTLLFYFSDTAIIQVATQVLLATGALINWATPRIMI